MGEGSLCPFFTNWSRPGDYSQDWTGLALPALPGQTGAPVVSWGGGSDCCLAIHGGAPAASPRAETQVRGGMGSARATTQFSQCPTRHTFSSNVRVYSILWILRSTFSLCFMDLNMYIFASFHGF